MSMGATLFHSFLHRSFRPLGAAIIVFLFAGVIATSLIWRLEQYRIQQWRAQASDTASEHAYALQRNIEHALSATQVLATLVRQGQGTISNFDEVAGSMLRLYPGVAELALVPGGVIRNVVPLAGNEKAVGLDLLRDPAQRQEALLARNSGKLTLAGPLELVQGGIGVVGRQPVFLEDDQGRQSFWGFTLVMMRMPAVLEAARVAELTQQGFAWELWRLDPGKRKKQSIAASSPADLIEPVQQNLSVPNAVWTLSVMPANGWGDPLGLALKAALGLLFSLLLGYLAKLLAESKAHEQGLEIEIARRTDEIAAREADLNRAQSIARVGSWALDIATIQLNGSPEAQRIIGASTSGPLSYKTILQLVHPDDRAAVDRVSRALIKGTPYDIEYRIVVGAATRWVHSSAELEFAADGKPTKALGTIQDITERKSAEEKLLRQNNMLSAIIANFPGGISVVDADLRVVAYNEQFKRLLDFPDSLFEKPDPVFEDFIRCNAERGEYGPGDVEQLVAASVARARNFHAHRIERVRPNGTALEIRGVPLPGGGFVTTYVDITERRRAEEKLHLFASVFTHAREGIVITDAECNIIEVNDAFSRISGYDREELLGRNPRMLQSGKQTKEFYVAMWRELVENGHWHGEIWNQRKGGQLYAEMLTISAVRDADGRTRQYVGLSSDITSLKEHERQLDHLAHYDALTTLPNRVLLADRLHQAMSQVKRRGQPLAVVYLDLDDFKRINDRHGHQAGDQLLVAIAARMKQALREGDTLARLGGDEFVAVLLDLADVEMSAPIIARLLAAADQPVQVGDLVLQVSASLGLTFYPQTEEVDADQLLRQADQAMYQAKLAGGKRHHVFDAAQDRSVRGHHEDLVHIGKALNQGEFVLHYQPSVNMRTGAVIGAEALIRWQHPERGLLSPAVFLPVIEDHPLAVGVGEWVIESALTQLERWNAAGLAIKVSVNIGARQLQQGDFIERLRTILAAHPNVRPGDLEMEVVETSALEDLARISGVIDACRQMGVRFALDDFGTGYSSLIYLKRLPVTQLKIDQSFVQDMVNDPDDLAILQGVLGLARAFRRDVTAEGVETVEQGKLLLRLGCEHAQGYAIARPMPADELQSWIASWRPDPAWLHLVAALHEDVPLLVASVQHRAWIRAIEAHLQGERAIAPPLDRHQCDFGTWLDAEGAARYGAQPAFATVETLHRQVHALVVQMCDLHARAKRADALAMLAELHALRDALFEQMKLLENDIR